MPNCFQLIRKSNLEAGPVVLQQIDKEMCQHFSVTEDPNEYHHYWYSIIGFGLACGKSFADMREIHQKQASYDEHSKHTVEIIDWLDANFSSDAWAEVGRK